jgi:hypothetical protein
MIHLSNFSNIRSVLASVITACVLGLLISACDSDSAPTSLQDDLFNPTIRAADVNENDTLQFTYNESSGNWLEIQFLDETQLASYSIQIDSVSTTVYQITEDTAGTQVIQTLNLRELRSNVFYSVIVTAEDEAGNNANLNFTLFIKEVESGYEADYDNIYLVGSSSPSGWSIADPHQLTQDDSHEGIFRYNGQLTAGEFKFSTYTGDFCGDDWIHPLEQGQDLTSTEYEILVGCSGDDFKWEISDTQAGTYSITINLEEEMIEIVAQ